MSAGNTRYDIPATPSAAGIRDCCLVSLFSLGEATSTVRKTSHKFIYRYKNWTLVTALWVVLHCVVQILRNHTEHKSDACP